MAVTVRLKGVWAVIPPLELETEAFKLVGNVRIHHLLGQGGGGFGAKVGVPIVGRGDAVGPGAQGGEVSGWRRHYC